MNVRQVSWAARCCGRYNSKVKWLLKVGNDSRENLRTAWCSSFVCCCCSLELLQRKKFCVLLIQEQKSSFPRSTLNVENANSKPAYWIYALNILSSKLYRQKFAYRLAHWRMNLFQKTNKSLLGAIFSPLLQISFFLVLHSTTMEFKSIKFIREHTISNS